MATLVTVLNWEFGLLMGALAFVVLFQMLTGRINLQGLLWEKDGTTDFSPGRVQFLIFTLIFAFAYVGKVMHDPLKLPEISQEMLWILGGSNVTYLGLKGYNLLVRQPRA